MHLLKSAASSIRAGRTAQHPVRGSFQYAFGCACGLLANTPSIEDALILNADPSNAAVNKNLYGRKTFRPNNEQKTDMSFPHCGHRFCAGASHSG